MMKYTSKKIGTLLFSFLIIAVTNAQELLPVGTPVLEDYYRRLQLLGKIDSTFSFSIRPISNLILQQNDIYNPNQDTSVDIKKDFNKEGIRWRLLPAEWKGQAISTYPYGWNDATMIPARGLQTYFSAGFYAQYKFLSVQLRPEFVVAQNSDFDTYVGRNESDWRIYWWDFANKIDAPERFGTGTYTKIFPGQSSIRLNFEPISIGVSTENLWWGPGMRNSLLMSNTAPGFLHATVNTMRPVRTGIGSFEAQLAVGKLEASGYTPKVLGEDDYHQRYYDPKPKDWRYFSGLVFSYQPKWVPGLSLGLINVFTVNSRDMGSKLGDYIPFFPSGSQTEEVDMSDPRFISDRAAQDQNVSVFARWLVPSVNFEIYGEYARNDRSWDLRDLTVSPNHSRSYIIGVNKLIPIRQHEDEYLQINAEVTQLEQSKSDILRSTGPMYYHYIVRDGYTHLGQPLGAGVGAGNNLQSLQINWLKGINLLGFQIERLVHNNDFLYRTVQDPRANWVDLGLACQGVYSYGKFLFTGKLQLSRAFNYQYRIEENNSVPDYWGFKKQDKSNFLFQIGAYYRL